MNNPAYCRPTGEVEVKLPPQSPNPWVFLMVYCQTVRKMHPKLANLCRLSPYYVDPSKMHSAVAVDATTEKVESVIKTQSHDFPINDINNTTNESFVVTDAATTEYLDASIGVPNGSIEAEIHNSDGDVTQGHRDVTEATTLAGIIAEYDDSLSPFSTIATTDVVTLSHDTTTVTTCYENASCHILTTPAEIIAEYDDSSSLFSTPATTDVVTLSHNTTTVTTCPENVSCYTSNKPIWTCGRVEYEDLTSQCFTDDPTDVVVLYHNTTTDPTYTEDKYVNIISVVYPEPSCQAVEAMTTSHTYDYESYG